MMRLEVLRASLPAHDSFGVGEWSSYVKFYPEGAAANDNATTADATGAGAVPHQPILARQLSSSSATASDGKAASREYKTKAQFRTSAPEYKQRFDLPVRELTVRFSGKSVVG